MLRLLRLLRLSGAWRGQIAEPRVLEVVSPVSSRRGATHSDYPWPNAVSAKPYGKTSVGQGFTLADVVPGAFV